MATKTYNYEWKTAEKILANRKKELYFRGWGITTLDEIASSTNPEDFKNAHKLWLKLKRVFNQEAAGYVRNDFRTTMLGSIGDVETREVTRADWWRALGGDSYGDYDIITRIIEALHNGQMLETGEILFGS
jgi:hypothetical protein